MKFFSLRSKNNLLKCFSSGARKATLMFCVAKQFMKAKSSIHSMKIEIHVLKARFISDAFLHFPFFIKIRLINANPAKTPKVARAAIKIFTLGKKDVVPSLLVIVSAFFRTA